MRKKKIRSATIEAVTREIDESEDERTRRSEWTKERTDKEGRGRNKKKKLSSRTPRCDRINYWFLPRPRPRRIFFFFLSASAFVSLLRPTFRLSQRTHESRLTQKGYIPNEVLGATLLFLYPPRISHSTSAVFRASILPVFLPTSFESNAASFFYFIRASNTSSRARQLVSVTIPYFTYF